ncbi:MAG: CBS domain-containing protein [Nitrospira sp.]|nr:CBS domain-containing protein [Nitrospira sp.]
MTLSGSPPDGRKTVGEVEPTNALKFYAEQNGLSVAAALLSTHTVGAPVVDANGAYLGFINECDVMKVLDLGQDLWKLQAKEIMRKDRLVITPMTSIAEAAKIMEQHQVLNLPVERGGVVAYSVSRHDLLRARVGQDWEILSRDVDFD